MFYQFDSNYSGNDFSFTAFEKVYAHSNSEGMSDRILETTSGKKYFFSISREGEKSDISFVYPFLTSSGQYMLLSLTNFTLTGANESDIRAIQDFFSSFDFPGVSPFISKK